jgi:sporulation protein YlmC with PRC-barrel domain
LPPEIVSSLVAVGISAADVLISGDKGDRMAEIKHTDPEKRFRRVMSASSLSGDRVRNTAGEDLGKVKELMIDIPSGRVAYAVLSFGGVLGLGDKLFAIPWNVLTLDEDEKQFILNADKTTLEKAPGFDQNNWPDMADPGWGTQIHSYYGVHPYWEEITERKTGYGRGGV